MKRTGILFVSLGLIMFLSPVMIQGPRGSGSALAGVAYAEENWKKEFDDICGKTQDAMIFSSDELKRLVDRCDKLKPLIEKLEETESKVYLRRLQMCRDLFAFTLESKQNK